MTRCKPPFLLAVLLTAIAAMIPEGLIDLNLCRATAADSNPTQDSNGNAKPSASGFIAGGVVDDSGRAEAGAKVSLFRLESPSERFGHWMPINKPVLSDKVGGFRFEKLADGDYLFDVKKSAFARTFCYRTIKKSQVNSQADIVLQPPAVAMIEISDESGKPVEGARVRAIRQAGKNGEVNLTQMCLRDLEIAIPASNSAGLLELPPLPIGDKLRITIDHPSLAPVKLENVIVAEGVVAKALMKPGIVLTFRRAATNHTENIASAIVDLRHEKFERPSTIIHYEIEFDRDGTGGVTIEPGNYSFLRLQHNDFYLTPTLMAEGPTFSPLHFEPGTNVELKFEVHRRLSAKGRVVDADTGLPVKGESLLGEIVSQKSAAAPDKTQMNFTGWAETDDKGEFTLPVAAGSARVEFHGSNRISETEFVDFIVASDGSTTIPDIKVRQLSKFEGIVRNPDGSPAARTVVRFRGKSIGGSHLADPVLTDENGRFELQPGFVPKDRKTNRRQFDQYLVAFDPHQPLAARIEVRLDKSQPLELILEPHDFDWPITEFNEDMGEWQRGIVTSDQAAENASISLRGRSAPDIAGADWINSEKLSWADLRGKYVLLDFWFIGCGPCHADFPSVKMAHDLYKDKGLFVIGVHNNSNPPDAVRKHVLELGLPFPIVVDQPDGLTVSRYERHGIARGFPSYVLIDPDGNVLLDDSTIPHPTLRGYKLEIIRKFLYGKTDKAATPN